MRRISLFFVPVCLFVLPLGCSDDSSKPNDDDPPSGYLEPTSITNVLANLKRSYEELNYEEYEKLLDPAFTFVFSPEDAGHSGIPDEWPLADEKISAEHLLSMAPNRDGYKAGEIELDFTAGDPVEDPPINPDWTLVRLSPVNLRVHSTHKDTGDILIYEVLNNQADLYFVKTGSSWKIIRWEDLPVGLNPSAGERTTWGQVKAIWR